MMKFVVLIFLIMSSSVFAYEAAIKRNFQIIDELNGQTFSYVGCDNNDPNAPAYCKDLYGYICTVEKTSDKRGVLDRELLHQHWNNLSRTPTHRHFNETVKVTHARSEESVFNLTNVMRDEIRNTLTDAKTALLQFITGTPLIKDEYKTQMAQKVRSVGLLYGKEYTDRLVRHAKNQNPNLNEEEVRAQANQLYMSACGMNGLEVNAFFEGGSLVLCPGLMISMSDYGGNKAEMLAALRFTIGHEVGHAIDAAAFPEAYSKMRGCYEEVSGNPNVWSPETAGEITADYWGAIALASNISQATHTKKLDPNKPEENARIIAYSVDGFCSAPPSAGSPHPEGSFRVNQSIGKHPYIARALNCEPAKEDAPYCSLVGAYSN